MGNSAHVDCLTGAINRPIGEKIHDQTAVIVVGINVITIQFHLLEASVCTCMNKRIDIVSRVIRFRKDVFSVGVAGQIQCFRALFRVIGQFDLGPADGLPTGSVHHG